MSNIRIGIFGTGGIARAHVKALSKLDSVSVTALCNHNIAKAQKFNAEHVGGAAKCYSSVDAMLADGQIDALYACIPPGAHAGEVERAAEKGVHLFLEKPIALTLERAQSIAAAVRKAGVKCQMGHNFRHTVPSIKLKSMIEDGSAGKPLMMQASWYTNRLHGDWWRDPKLGGGQLVEQAIHLFDLARYFLGEAESVTGAVGRLGHDRFPEYRVDDTSAATIRFRNGAIASLCASNCGDPWSSMVSATIICEKLFVQFNGPQDSTFMNHRGMTGEEAWPSGIERAPERVQSPDNGNDEISRNFIAGIRGTEPLRSSVEDGVEGLKLVLAVASGARL